MQLGRHAMTKRVKDGDKQKQVKDRNKLYNRIKLTRHDKKSERWRQTETSQGSK